MENKIKVNLKLTKDWCNSYINEFAWKRIGLELYDKLLGAGIDFDQINNPKNSDLISAEIFELINNKAIEVYDIAIEREIVEL